MLPLFVKEEDGDDHSERSSSLIDNMPNLDGTSNQNYIALPDNNNNE